MNIITLLILSFTTAGLASPIAAPAPFPVNADTLNCRASPSTSAAIIKKYPKGFDVRISCQTTGPKVGTTTVWDKTQDGCYVSDYYVSTGHSAWIPGVPRCGGSNDGGSSGSCQTLNAASIGLIKRFEGFVRSPAPDPIGLPTVGYGHLCQTKSCGEAGPFPLTPAAGEALLKKDVGRFTSCLSRQIANRVTLNDNQWGALVSWAFNVGCGNTGSSTLVKRLNSGQNPNTVAEQELPKWNKAGGKTMPGLVRRRAAEVVLFKTASGKTAHPRCG